MCSRALAELRQTGRVFERFNDEARQGWQLADAHARRLGRSHLGTEHLLLGLLTEQDTLASSVLMSVRIDPQVVAAELEQDAEPAAVASGSTDPLPCVPAVERVPALARRESRQLGDHTVRPCHLLLALLADTDGPAARVLRARGARLEPMRRHVLYLLDGHSADALAAALTPPHTLSGRARHWARARTTTLTRMVTAVRYTASGVIAGVASCAAQPRKQDHTRG